jgi:2-dehydropantoate 2-reductase
LNKVAIIGPGALGCLFAARFAQAGIQVSLVDYREDRAAILNEFGITVTAAEGDLHQQITVTTEVPDTADLALVLVKSHATASLNLPMNIPVLTLQNGLGNAEILAEAGITALMAGTTSEAVTWLDTGCVRHVARGKTVFGAWTPCNTEAPLHLLQSAGFDAMVTDDPAKAIWKKAIINAGINPLAAILNVPNGALLDKQESRDLLHELILESLEVAGVEGYTYHCSIVEETENICEVTRDNICSMLQDIRNHKRTEIDAISGEILRRAYQAGFEAPHTHTIYNLVCALEQL